MTDDLYATLRPILARRRSPVQRRALAAAFRALADEQESLAAADERIGATLRGAQLDSAPRKGGRPKGSGGSFVRWSPRAGASGQLQIAPRLWRELGEPGRLDVQRAGRTLFVQPCLDGQGWAVTRPPGPRGGLPRLGIGHDAADALGLIEGRWEAQVRAGAIVAEMM